MGLWNRVSRFQGGCLHRVDKLCLTWEWEVSEKMGTADNICVCVYVHEHRGTTFDKHEEITMRCCQRVLSLAGGWKQARSVIFSDEQRTRDDASYRFAHAHSLKHDTCMPAHIHLHTYAPGPWYWICAFTSNDSIPDRAGRVNITTKRCSQKCFCAHSHMS